MNTLSKVHSAHKDVNDEEGLIVPVRIEDVIVTINQFSSTEIITGICTAYSIGSNCWTILDSGTAMKLSLAEVLELLPKIGITRWLNNTQTIHQLSSLTYRDGSTYADLGFNNEHIKWCSTVTDLSKADILIIPENGIVHPSIIIEYQDRIGELLALIKSKRVAHSRLRPSGNLRILPGDAKYALCDKIETYFNIMVKGMSGEPVQTTSNTVKKLSDAELTTIATLGDALTTPLANLTVVQIEDQHDAVYIQGKTIGMTYMDMDRLNLKISEHAGYLHNTRFFKQGSDVNEVVSLSNEDLKELANGLQRRKEDVDDTNNDFSDMLDSMGITEVVNLSAYSYKPPRVKYVVLSATGTAAILLPARNRDLTDDVVLTLHEIFTAANRSQLRRVMFSPTDGATEIIKLSRGEIDGLAKQVHERAGSLIAKANRKNATRNMPAPRFKAFPVLDTVRGLQTVLDFTYTLESNANMRVVTPAMSDLSGVATVVVLPRLDTVIAVAEAGKLMGMSKLSLDTHFGIIMVGDDGYKQLVDANSILHMRELLYVQPVEDEEDERMPINRNRSHRRSR